MTGPVLDPVELGLAKSYLKSVTRGVTSKAAWLVWAACVSLTPAHAQWLGQSQRSLTQCVPVDELMSRGQVQRDPNQPLSIRALNLSATPNQPIEADSGVVLVRGDQRLETEAMVYDPNTGLITLPGVLVYTDAFIAIEANTAQVNIDQSTGDFQTVDYRINGAQGSGHAERVELLNERQAELTVFDFTTCDPTQPDWQLMAKDVVLDLDRSVGTAKGARLMFKGVPLFYLPYFTFPLSDERKSGFLYPRFGLSSSDGLDLSMPWYWNIAPNMDATFTPRWIQDRGVMLGNEFRFLQRRQSGEVLLDALPGDDKTQSDRYFAQVDYRLKPAPNWAVSARFRRVSDAQYFLDLGGGLDATAIQYMRSSATLRGRGQYWSMRVGADFFQVLDDRIAARNEPYRRLPRVLLDIDRPLSQRVHFEMDNELVYFDRDEGTTGARVDLWPRLTASHIASAGFARAEAGVRMTRYALDNAAIDSASRTTPILSLDGGLVFERPAGGNTLQTLEPRLYYLYVPTKDQDKLPVFDTSALTFGFSQLFHSNRFSGADRQSGANQLTWALTSRWLDERSGQSRVDVNVGQVIYFQDRTVQLPGQSIDATHRSDFIAEANWSLARSTAVKAGLQWDPEADALSVAYASLAYQGDGGLQGALSYRFRDQVLDQVDARVRIPLTGQLSFIGRSVYSLKDDDSLELLAGIEYESCCWAVRLTAREYIRDREVTKQTAVFLELHLKGLGSLGRQPYPLF